MADGPFNVPGAAWKHRFDDPNEQVRGPSKLLSLGGIIKMLPMIWRIHRHNQTHSNTGFDPVSMMSAPPGPYQGVPLGGIGSGSIGRGWRGDFRRWQLRSGNIQQQPVWADQFSVRVERAGSAQSTVLFPGGPDDGSLSGWGWDLLRGDGEYRALFPRAWHVYPDAVPDVKLTCRQLSPVIPHNYRESSFPVSEFRWLIENTGETPARVSLMFTFQNGTGGPSDQAGGHSNHAFRADAPQGTVTGVRLRHSSPIRYGEKNLNGSGPVHEDPLEFAIAAMPPADGQASFTARFAASGDGADLWDDFSDDGRLSCKDDAAPSAPGETIGAAVVVTVLVPPGEARQAAFALAWDMPILRLGAGTAYTRRYARFFAREQHSDPAAALAVEALRCADDWEAQIERWQAPILADESLPGWYPMALFNELYYLVDGGVIWAYPREEIAPPDPEMGRFAYLEGHEYRMLNTYDVHFYASWALIQLWPKLELALQRDIAAATLAEYPDRFTEAFSGRSAPRKERGAVPHDIGWPYEAPWERVNGYFIHNVNDWKDLNPKFVLQVYRDFLLTGDRKFVRDVWEAVEAAIRRANRFDRDGDGLIENDGFPDQTYDVWSVRGPSAYTGGLWLACLTAGAELAEIAGEPELAAEYRRMFEQGRRAYDEKLWNGRYFNYDSSRSRQHDSIMADQMAGQWYARACCLPPVVDPVKARSALMTVYDWNVLRFGDGCMGAVNGMRPDGRVDTTSMQSQEVWSGTSYAAAAAMIHEGLRDEAFTTAHGVWRMTYQGTGYWFQTPEAWDEEGNYRAIGYMRPLAIWAMQWALQGQK